MLIVAAIMLMSIGFAAVSTVLYINGNTKVASHLDDFDVYFSETHENGVLNNNLIKDKKHIVFEAELSKVGDVYKLEYEVTNASKNYDVDITLNVPNGNEYIKVTNDFDTSVMEARSARVGMLTLELLKGVTEEKSFEFEMTIVVNGVERTSLGEDLPSIPYKEDILNGTDPV